jgi:hypothetical protein
LNEYLQFKNYALILTCLTLCSPKYGTTHVDAFTLGTTAAPTSQKVPGDSLEALIHNAPVNPIIAQNERDAATRLSPDEDRARQTILSEQEKEFKRLQTERKRMLRVSEKIAVKQQDGKIKMMTYKELTGDAPSDEKLVGIYFLPDKPFIVTTKDSGESLYRRYKTVPNLFVKNPDGTVSYMLEFCGTCDAKSCPDKKIEVLE